METMRLIRWAAAVLSVGTAVMAIAAPGPWDQPAAALAEKGAGILGPGQAHLTIRNISSIPAGEVPAIRKALEDDLRAHGVAVAGEESANAIRITLSESAHEGLWVAEVVEGNVTQVAMVETASLSDHRGVAQGGMALRRQMILTLNEPVLAALEYQNGLVLLEPDAVVFYVRSSDGWHEFKRVNIGQKQPLPRDPRGLMIQSAGGAGFTAWLAGAECEGPLPVGDGAASCRASDDPWPISRGNDPPATFRAFYNAARNYFTGVLTPGLGVDLPRFYASAWIPRAAGGEGLVIEGIDGRTQIVENGTLKAVSGTRDWGSDFVALNSGCGAGWQIVASSSGQAANDSLRAYEVPALEAIPASAPLELSGSVEALEAESDARSAIAIVRTLTGEYEVDRVTALCN
jgi:hypothetical protein